LYDVNGIADGKKFFNDIRSFQQDLARFVEVGTPKIFVSRNLYVRLFWKVSEFGLYKESLKHWIILLVQKDCSTWFIYSNDHCVPQTSN